MSKDNNPPEYGHPQADVPQDVVFSARLTPYRSLGPTGFRVLIGCIGIICLMVSLVFFLAGVWPVAGFMGLDFLLIYWAFKANYRDARRFEDIEVSRSRVLLRKVAPSGRTREHQFPQFGTRLEVDRHDEIGITTMSIVNRVKRVEFGKFLNPDDRESFALAFGNALRRAKG